MKRFLTFCFSLVLFFVVGIFSKTFAGCAFIDPEWCIQDGSGIPNTRALNFGECRPGSDNFNFTKCYMLNKNHTVGGVYDTPGTIIGTIVNNLMIVGGLVLFGMIIYAGFLMIKGGYKGFEEARGVLIKALLGLIVMFVAYWLVMIISYLTGVKIPGIN